MSSIDRQLRDSSTGYRASNWFYAFALFGLVGGFIGYLYLRHLDPATARGVLVAGIVIGIVVPLVALIVISAVAPS